MSDLSFHDGRVVLRAGDCLAVLDTLADNSVDAVVTDPPYHLLSTVKRFGAVSQGDDTKTAQRARDGADRMARLSRGFMGKEWDGGDIVFTVELWAKVFRVLKPGGHLVAFAAPKCAHRMVCAIEDAGFEIRDGLMWMFGTGFPKSLDIFKAIDKAAGAEREVVAMGDPIKRMIPGADQNKAGWEKNDGRVFAPAITAPATDAAKEWNGWGTALKPAYEPICLARKPIAEKTVAANVLRWGTGGLNISACRVGEDCTARVHHAEMGYHGGNSAGQYATGSTLGRWPANVCHDGSDEVVAGFPDSDGQQFATGPQYGSKSSVNVCGDYGPVKEFQPRGVSGSAARFFYSAKADADDRIGSKHPTVKPVALMRWLARLVTPDGGTILDPFAGTGTTGHAALLEGFKATLIEREAEYRADIARRMGLVFAGRVERVAARMKARGQTAPVGGLFDGMDAQPPAEGGGGRLVYGKFARDTRSAPSE